MTKSLDIADLLRNHPFITEDPDPEQFNTRRVDYVLTEIKDAMAVATTRHKNDTDISAVQFYNYLNDALWPHIDDLTLSEASYLIAQIGLMMQMTVQRVFDYQIRDQTAEGWLPEFTGTTCCVSTLISNGSAEVHPLEHKLTDAYNDFCNAWIDDPSKKTPPQQRETYNALRSVAINHLHSRPKTPVQRAVLFQIGYLCGIAEETVEAEYNRRIDLAAAEMREVRSCAVDGQDRYDSASMLPCYPECEVPGKLSDEKVIMDGVYKLIPGTASTLSAIIDRSISLIVNNYRAGLAKQTEPVPPNYFTLNNAISTAIKTEFPTLSVNESLYIQNVIGGACMNGVMLIRQITVQENMRGMGGFLGTILGGGS